MRVNRRLALATDMDGGRDGAIAAAAPLVRIIWTSAGCGPVNISAGKLAGQRRSDVPCGD